MKPLGSTLEHAALAVTRWAGGPWAFVGACSVVLLWAVFGPVFGFSNTWQLVINTGTTIVTFLMVFLIQRSQNKDTQAIELKLNELVAAIDGASNRLINVEDLDEGELRTLHAHYQALARLSMKEERLTRSHSIEQAEARHRVKARSVNGSKEIDDGIHPRDGIAAQRTPAQRRRPVRGRDRHPARAIPGSGA